VLLAANIIEKFPSPNEDGSTVIGYNIPERTRKLLVGIEELFKNF